MEIKKAVFSCDQAALWMVQSVRPSVCLSVCPSRLFSCDQAAIWLVLSVRPSVCLSVTPFSPCSHHRIIMKFSGVITMVRSDVHAKGQGHTRHTAGSSIEEVPYCFSRSCVKFQGHTALKIVEFDPDWAFPDCNSSFDTQMATKWCTKLEVASKRCPIVFQGHASNFKVTRL